MKTPMTWLLVGAALTLCAGATVAVAADQDPAAAIRQAQEDARSAQAEARTAQIEAERAREKARRARDEARRVQRDVDVHRDVHIHSDGSSETRIYRNGGDRDMIVIRGGGREESLSRLLQLRPGQQPALKAFLEATRSDRDRHGRDHMVRFDRDTDSRTTLQRLDEMQSKAAEQKAEMDRKVAAIKTFYGQLDARQKQAFDAMPMLMVVGPTVGPMMIPRPMPIVHRIPPAPPVPPVPPVPPARPRS